MNLTFAAEAYYNGDSVVIESEGKYTENGEEHLVDLYLAPELAGHLDGKKVIVAIAIKEVDLPAEVLKELNKELEKDSNDARVI